MAFKALFLGHSPDADPATHHCVIDTGLYQFYAVVARNQRQGVEICRQMVKEEGIHSIILCPGHTHADIAEIAAAVGKNVSISVARGDGPSSKIAVEVMTREGWFAARQ